ncbi:MAG: AMP-binding protein [Flammeovirgaceae bacterium]|nr:AMP-binding protein [Flammeovirgaceae bacterium]
MQLENSMDAAGSGLSIYKTHCCPLVGSWAVAKENGWQNPAHDCRRCLPPSRNGRLFSAAGIQIIEGYGMTETAPLIAVNRFEPGLNMFGTVGLIVPGVDAKIDSPSETGEGEILVKGPNLSQGYFKRQELNNEMFTSDGWFKTGDVGMFVKVAFLKLQIVRKIFLKPRLANTLPHNRFKIILPNHLLYNDV